jgi:hypothetical protein
MIYVDALVHHGMKLHGRHVQSCHMVTDSKDLTEIHAFAEMLGLKRTWFQSRGRLPHYDLTHTKRIEAINRGAKEINRRQLVSLMMSGHI